MVGDVREHLGENNRMELFSVVGMVTGEVSGESAMGKWRGFRGRFIAKTIDGAKKMSGRLFLPGASHDVVAAILYEAAGVSDISDEMRPTPLPQTTVYVVKASNSIGYEYEADVDVEGEEDHS